MLSTAGTGLFLGNSMPIRDMDMYAASSDAQDDSPQQGSVRLSTPLHEDACLSTHCHIDHPPKLNLDITSMTEGRRMIANSADCSLRDVTYLWDFRIQIVSIKPCHAAFLRRVGNLSLQICIIKP